MFEEYEEILGLPQLAALEDEFAAKPQQLGVPGKKAGRLQGRKLDVYSWWPALSRILK